MHERLFFCCLFALATTLPAVFGHAQSGLTRSPVSGSPRQRLTSREGLVPVTPRAGVPSTETPVSRLQPPNFDAYGTGPDAASSPPSLMGAPPAQPFSGSSQPYLAPGTTTTPGAFNNGVYQPQPFPQQPPMLFPNAGPSLFPNGMGVPGGWPQAQPGPYMRLFQDVRFTYTWVAGDTGPSEMDTNDVSLATTVNFPNFLWSGQPLHVSPVFVFHFWDGPDSGGGFPTQLPSRVYSTYLESRWQPMLTPMFGGDLDVSVGVFSDFGKVDQDSVRLQGTGVFVLALTPTITAKAGINYLDRVDLKLLPAAGIVWTPNPQTRFDIFFPKPKLAQYLTTVGNTDVWWYLNGEYGGGSWSVARPGIADDHRMDINDIRVGGGLEWTGHTGLRGFVEAAYVFDRELFFASAAGPPPQALKDSIMVRGGLSY